MVLLASIHITSSGAKMARASATKAITTKATRPRKDDDYYHDDHHRGARRTRSRKRIKAAGRSITGSCSSGTHHKRNKNGVFFKYCLGVVVV